LRFKIDENLPEDVVALLRTAGHDASSVVGQSLKGISDSQLLKACLQEQRILVALDLGFADIQSFNPEVSPGIIVLRIRRQDKSGGIKAIRKALGLMSPDRLQHHLVIVEETQIRMRGERVGDEAE
jgi:predicted nuclease of predicted toxin-antitoxin system